MNFIFECSTRYITSERSEWVRYRVEHEKIKFIFTSGHVIFCLLYKHQWKVRQRRRSQGRDLLCNHDDGDLFTCEDIEDITWPPVDMNFIFECSTRYITSERSEWVRYRVEHEKIKFIFTSGHVIFCLFLTTFRRFSIIVLKKRRTFSNIFRTFSEDNRRFPRRDRWCFDQTATHLSTF